MGEDQSCADVFAVAAHVLREAGPMTTGKLHQLCYRAQGHHLAVTGRPLFEEKIYARAAGPRVGALEEVLGTDADRQVVDEETLLSRLGRREDEGEGR